MFHFVCLYLTNFGRVSQGLWICLNSSALAPKMFHNFNISLHHMMLRFCKLNVTGYLICRYWWGLPFSLLCFIVKYGSYSVFCLHETVQTDNCYCVYALDLKPQNELEFAYVFTTLLYGKLVENIIRSQEQTMWCGSKSSLAIMRGGGLHWTLYKKKKNL